MAVRRFLSSTAASFPPPPLPISIERHHAWLKQIHEFVMLGAWIFCRIDLVAAFVSAQLHLRDEKHAIGLIVQKRLLIVEGKLSPCHEPGTPIVGEYDRPAALHVAFVQYRL